MFVNTLHDNKYGDSVTGILEVTGLVTLPNMP